MKVKEFQGFSEDGKSFVLLLEKLEPAKKYQIVVGPGFTSKAGFPVFPYLIEFETEAE